MAALVHQLKQQTDHGILDEIQNANCYSLFVEYRGRWILGCRTASLQEARETALLAFQRSGLPVEIRKENGDPVLGMRSGNQDLDSSLA